MKERLENLDKGQQMYNAVIVLVKQLNGIDLMKVDCFILLLRSHPKLVSHQILSKPLTSHPDRAGKPLLHQAEMH